jgi:hypothetical protein
MYASYLRTDSAYAGECQVAMLTPAVGRGQVSVVPRRQLF